MVPALIVLVTALVVLQTGAGAGHAAPALSSLSPIQIQGNWTINSSVSYANVTVVVGGSLVVASGGSLDLTNVTLEIAEPSSLAHGIDVRSGGAFLATNSTIESGSAGVPLWMQAESGSAFSWVGGVARDFGGSRSFPGLVLLGAHARVDGVRFAGYYRGVTVLGSNDSVVACQFLNTTATDPTQYTVTVQATGANFTLQDSILGPSSDAGALSIVAPRALVSGNQFELNGSGPNYNPIWIGYSGAVTSAADGTRFVNNTVTGSDVVVAVASNVSILGNVVNGPGGARPYGIVASVPFGTGSGRWMTGLTIDHNVVENYTPFGIRVELNVTRFTIDNNTLRDPLPPAVAGTSQPNGIYAIRSVNNGTIAGNYLDMYAGATVPTIGVCLESNVSDVVVRDNVVVGATQHGINIQGNDGVFDGARPWQTGPSDRNVVERNLFLLDQLDQQTKYYTSAINLWQWSNYTSVVNNTILGWDRAASRFSLNGAAVLTSSSYGLFTGNLVENATYGFVFQNFGSVNLTTPGAFNRSANLVYGNALYGIAKAGVVEGSGDGMGPIANVLDVLWNAPSRNGTPSSYLESIHGATFFSGRSSGGTYAAALGTLNPITGRSSVFSTQLNWSAPSFAVTVTGPIGSGVLTIALPRAVGGFVNYSLPAQSDLTHSLCVGSTPVEAHVKVTGPGGLLTSRDLSSTYGNVTFTSSYVGELGVTAELTNSTDPGPFPGTCLSAPSPPPPSPGNGGTNSSEPWTLTAIGSAVGPDGAPLVGASVKVQILWANLSTTPSTTSTNSEGVYTLEIPTGPSASVTELVVWIYPASTLDQAVEVVQVVAFAAGNQTVTLPRAQAPSQATGSPPPPTGGSASPPPSSVTSPAPATSRTVSLMTGGTLVVGLLAAVLVALLLAIRHDRRRARPHHVARRRRP